MKAPFKEEWLIGLLNKYKKRPVVWLETGYLDQENTKSLLFAEWRKVITFYYGDDLNKFFKEIEDCLKKGWWLAGYFSYEFGYYWEEKLKGYISDRKDFPLVWLVATSSPLIFNHTKKNEFSLKKLTLDYQIENLRFNIGEEEYSQSIKKIKKYLREGETYQVNFTFKCKFNFKGDIVGLYLDLRRAQPTSYQAFINDGRNYILSFSPELFFRIHKKNLITRPMKGTVKRGLWIEDDEKKKEWLKRNSKNRAENIMIVDLLRNDLGKISTKAGVTVKELFRIESYRTIHQMTSTIQAKLKTKDVKKIWLALFPCGSITGAPKIRTMQIIKELEKEDRGVYTGAVGYISPYESCFNVAIRTIVIRENKGEMGVGGGIVFDSNGKQEFEEAKLKSLFLVKKFPYFHLIESILFSKGEYFLLDLHLARLKASAQYFSIPLESKKVEEKLLNLAKQLKKGKFKVRVLVSLEGEVDIKIEELEEVKKPVKIKLSSVKIEPNNIFLYHKTTQRLLYEKEREKAKQEGFYDVLFINKYGEVTETATANIFVFYNEELITPPIRCGLLGGVLREFLLKEGKVKEEVIYPSHLLNAQKVFIGNSVRGLLEAEVVREWVESKV